MTAPDAAGPAGRDVEGVGFVGLELEATAGEDRLADLGCMPGHTGCEHLLYNEIVVADAITAM